MRKLKKALIVCTLGVTAIVLIVLHRHAGEPSSGGRQLSEWLKLYGPQNGRIRPAEEKEKAADAIRQIGTNALPLLLVWIHHEPAGWRYKIGPISEKLPKWINQSKAMKSLIIDSAAERAENARDSFAILGPRAKPAIPELVRLMNLTNSPATRDNAMLALSSIGPDALPVMMEVVSNLDRTGGLWEMACIRNMGTNARPLVPTLVHTLQSTNWFTAMITARMLGELKFDPDLVIPALTKCLQDPRRELRMTAPEALGEFGDLARSSLPALSNALADTSHDVRINAARAIYQIAAASITNATSQ